jgi:hypothetical protein
MQTTLTLRTGEVIPAYTTRDEAREVAASLVVQSTGKLHILGWWAAREFYSADKLAEGQEQRWVVLTGEAACGSTTVVNGWGSKARAGEVTNVTLQDVDCKKCRAQLVKKGLVAA